ncbi:hypothetical protein Q2941_46310 [Bradyrhizobium sp. UFLA05-153]
MRVQTCSGLELFFLMKAHERVADLIELPVLFDAESRFVRLLACNLCQRGPAGVALDYSNSTKMSSHVGVRHSFIDINTFSGRARAATNTCYRGALHRRRYGRQDSRTSSSNKRMAG